MSPNKNEIYGYVLLPLLLLGHFFGGLDLEFLLWSLLSVFFLINLSSELRELRPENIMLIALPLVAKALLGRTELLFVFPVIAIGASLYFNKLWFLICSFLLSLPILSLGNLSLAAQLLSLGPVVALVLIRYLLDQEKRFSAEILCLFPLLFTVGSISTDLSIQILAASLLVVGILTRNTLAFAVLFSLAAQSFVELGAFEKVALALLVYSGGIGSSLALITCLFLNPSPFPTEFLFIAGLSLVCAAILNSRQETFYDRAWIALAAVAYFFSERFNLTMSYYEVGLTAFVIIVAICSEFFRKQISEKLFSSAEAKIELSKADSPANSAIEKETDWNSKTKNLSTAVYTNYEYVIGFIATGYILVWFYFT